MPNLITQLEECETEIAAGLETVEKVGRALLRIKNEQLYRDGYASYEQYVQERWGWTVRHANRMVAASNVVESLGPIGPKPVKESHIRELAKLPAEKRQEAWETAQEEADANDEPLTAKTVAAVVARRLDDRPDSPVDDPSPDRTETNKPAPVDSVRQDVSAQPGEGRTVIDFWKPVREQIFTFAKSLSDADRGALGATLIDAGDMISRNQF